MILLLRKGIFLLAFCVILCGMIYPLTLWMIGQLAFPFQANGSLRYDNQNRLIGSTLIAQPFTEAGYFQPRPSAASYDAAASAASSLAPSNYALRDRVARALGPIATYRSGPKAGELVGPDLEAWFKRQPDIVGKWAIEHSQLAQAWVKEQPARTRYIEQWAKSHSSAVAQFIAEHPEASQPTATDLATLFFQKFSTENPGRFPLVSTTSPANAGEEPKIELIDSGAEIQSIFFDMWRQANPQIELTAVPADMVTASCSGLDPHISWQSALFQLERIASHWGKKTGKPLPQIKQQINQILEQHAFAPLLGLSGEKLINVLEVNLELHQRYTKGS